MTIFWTVVAVILVLAILAVSHVAVWASGFESGKHFAKLEALTERAADPYLDVVYEDNHHVRIEDDSPENTLKSCYEQWVKDDDAQIPLVDMPAGLLSDGN